MKKAIHTILYSLCCVVLVIGLLGCVLTAFSVKGADYTALFWYTTATVAVFTVLSVFLKSSKIFAAVTLSIVAVDLIVLVINRHQLKLSTLNFTNIIARKLHSAYPWIRPVQTEAFNIDVFLICVSVLLAILFTLSLLRWRSTLPVALISVAALMPCYLVRNTPPNAFPLMTCAVILLSMFIVRLYHRKNSDLTPAVFVPAAAILAAAALMIQSISGEPSEWMKNLSTAIPGLGGSQATSGTGIDFGSEVDLNRIEDLKLNHLPELRVSTDLPDGELYLKDTSFGSFDNNTWRIETSGDWNDDAYPSQDYLGIPNIYDPGTLYSTEVTSLIKRTNLPHPYRLSADHTFATSYELNRDANLTRKDGKTDEASFFSLATEPESTWDKESNPNLYYEYTRNHYTAYPSDLLYMPSEDEGLSDAANEGSTGEIVSAVYTYFEQLGGTYSTRVTAIPKGQDYLSWFTEHREGWCIHYATAAVLILRELGVPARYVTGYRATFGSDEDDKKNKTLTQQSRHAWAEYYDELLGWRIFDVTPGLDDDNGAVEQQEPATEAEQPTTAAASTQTNGAAQETTQSSDGTQPTTQQGGQPTAPTTPSDGSDPTNGNGNKIAKQQEDTPQDYSFLLIPLFILLGLAALTGGVLLRRKLICDRRQRLINQRDRSQAAIYAYRYLERLLRLTESEPPEHITAIAEKAKYSRTGVTGEEFQTLREYLNQTLAALDERTNSVVKLIYRYVLCLY